MRSIPSLQPYTRKIRVPAYGVWIFAGIIPLGYLLYALFNSSGWDGLIIMLMIIHWGVLWLVVFVVRLLIYSSAKEHQRAHEWHYQKELKAWWDSHRETAAMLETFLLAPACHTLEQRHDLLNICPLPPTHVPTSQGGAL